MSNVISSRAVAVSAALFAMTLAGTAADALQAPQDLAVKLTGTWVLNRDLSTGFGAPGRGRGPGGRPAPLFAMASPAQGRRGGGGGGGDASDLTPDQRAQQAAMRQLEQIDERITIKASADSVSFVDARGERTYGINDKSSEILVASSPVKVKSKWDKQVLKQEFSNAQAKLVQTWSVDATDHLVLTAKVESLTLVTPERKAVFNRQ
jgi:hypothetical protein